MDFSGSGINKVYKSGVEPDQPYYYINASLDLSGRARGTYYFNQDNNFDYALNRSYNRYILVDSNMLIGEIAVYANNDLVDVDAETPVDILIGGAEAPSQNGQVVVPWAAPMGSVPGVGDILSSSDINAGSVHLYGREGGHTPFASSPNSYKYLAISLDPFLEAERSSLPKRSKRQMYRGLPSGDPVFLEGKVSVSIKVYPKIQ
jgi:hypothetical protein